MLTFMFLNVSQEKFHYFPRKTISAPPLHTVLLALAATNSDLTETTVGPSKAHLELLTHFGSQEEQFPEFDKLHNLQVSHV